MQLHFSVLHTKGRTLLFAHYRNLIAISDLLTFMSAFLY